MRWTSQVSEETSLNSAVAECAAQVRSQLGDRDPDVALVFVSPHFSLELGQAPEVVRRRLHPRVLIGCSGRGVIGGGREVEDRACVSVTAALLPGVDLMPFHVEERDLPDLDASPSAWQRLTRATSEQKPDFLLLADPFTIRADNLLAGLDYAFPGRAKVGGLASGFNQAGGNALFLGDRVHWSGAVGLALSGAVQMDALIARGCRPIGNPMVVTNCHRNVLLEIDGQKPLAVVRAIFDGASERDRALINRELHIGVVTDRLKQNLGPADFLIRNILGVQDEVNGLVVGETLSDGQVVRFYVRDAEAARADLVAVLRQYAQDRRTPEGAGALLFSCLGRGIHLFGQPDHDTKTFQNEVGPLPVGGFFCNGEIGPADQGTFLHSFTSTFAILRPA